MSRTKNTTTGNQDLLRLCRNLTDHLSAYAISAGRFDEKAFYAVQQAERIMFDARRNRRDEPGNGDFCSVCGDVMQPGHTCN